MKLIEAENYLNTFVRYNLKVEIKSDIFEYTTKSANPILQTLINHNFIEIPLFV